MAKSWRRLKPWEKTKDESRGEENEHGLENKRGEMETPIQILVEVSGLFPVNLISLS